MCGLSMSVAHVCLKIIVHERSCSFVYMLNIAVNHK